MPLAPVILSPGSELRSWVEQRVRARAFPLDPTTFVMPTHLSGRALRRGLATIGYANVRTATLSEIAAAIGSAALAARGLAPLEPALEDAAIRAAVVADHDTFGTTHPALVETLRRLFRRFRDIELDEAGLNDVAAAGTMARASVAAYRRFRETVQEAHRYDSHDLFESAIEHLPTSGRLLSEWGDLALLYPGDLPAAARRFVAALAQAHEIPLVLAPMQSPLVLEHFRAEWPDLELPATPAPDLPPIRLLTANEAAEEVTLVVKELLAGLGDGQRLDRAGIVYRQPEPYASLVRDTLRRANVPFTGLDGRPLAESIPGKAFLGLLKMRATNFGRPEVVEWHGYLPHRANGGVAVADWERLSRAAGVVRGADQWAKRLARLRDGVQAELEALGLKDQPNPGREAYLQFKAQTIQQMSDRIADLAAQVQPPADRTWEATAAWASQLLTTFIPAQSSWEEREREALEMITAEVEALRAAGPVEAVASVETLLDSLTSALQVRTQTEGKLGVGVVVGSLQAVSAMDFDRVYVLGVTEKNIPTAPPADPVLPLLEDRDLLGLRRRHQALERLHFESVINSVPEGHATLCYPVWDPNTRPAYPSPWLVDLLSAQDNHELTAAEVRDGARSSRSERAATTPMNLADFRMLQARAQVATTRLEDSPVARRSDLPVGRHLATVNARRSTQLTEFDGCLEGASHSSAYLQGGIAGRTVSPTAVEEWAKCPFHYLLNRWIGVEATEVPEDVQDWSLSAVVRGGVMHSILEEFFRDLSNSGRFVAGYRYTAEDHRRIEEIAGRHFNLLEEAGDTGLTLAWESETEVLLQNLHTILDRDEEERGDALVPVFFERAFGFDDTDSWPTLSVDLGDGRAASIRGRIDRVDVHTTPAGFERLRVLDYKTGSSWGKPMPEDPLKAGTKLQLPAYMRAAATWLESQGMPSTQIEAAYWYISRKAEFELASLQLTPELSAEFDRVIALIDAGMRKGCFPQVPGKETMRGGKSGWDNCMYCSYNQLCPTGRDQVYERKKGDPVAAIHAQMAVPEGGE